MALDVYGGYVGLPVPGGATGRFRLAKVNNRWVFADALGNAFWCNGMYNVTRVTDAESDAYKAPIPPATYSSYSQRTTDGGSPKYPDAHTWALQQSRRLRQYGFNNATGSDFRMWGDPTPVTGTEATGRGLPIIHLFQMARECRTNHYNRASHPVHDLISMSSAAYAGYRGSSSPDVFDPAFEAYYLAYLDPAWDGTGTAWTYTNPWLLGVMPDDKDYLVGFGAGPDMGAPSGPHPHLGWIVLIAKFSETVNGWSPDSDGAKPYTDPNVYSKLALRDMLITKYGTIGALNTAWGSTYTSFNSAGGYGTGTGLLDENGLMGHSWAAASGSFYEPSNTTVKADLDDYLLMHARKYFEVSTGAVRTRFDAAAAGGTGVLIFGPAPLNNFDGGLTRTEILQAAGEYCDASHVTCTDDALYDATAAALGDLPMLMYSTSWANPDSGLSPYDPGFYDTQEERATAYNTVIIQRPLTRVTGGRKQGVGHVFWEYIDNWGEHTNYGLVSSRDNLYDGAQATIAGSGNDTWGYPTGGEPANYGDFLGGVLAAHNTVEAALAADLNVSLPKAHAVFYSF